MDSLVLGATGLLGSYIVDECVKKDQSVRVLVRTTSALDHLKQYADLDYCYGDLNDFDSLLKATEGVETVYHSAGRVTDWGNRKQFYVTNFIGTKNVVKACRANGVKKLVYVSSPSVVFDYKDEVGIDESYPYPKKFANHYSESKALSEQYVLDAHTPGGLEVAVLRPHAIWGPRDKTGFLPRMVGKVRKNKLPNLSGGRPVYVDICHAVNAAHACVLAAMSPHSGGNIYFISDDEPIDAWEFVDDVSKRLDLAGVGKPVNPNLLKPLVAILELIWKIPWLAGKVPLPLNKYALGVLTCSTTYNIAAAKRDLDYQPVIDRHTALCELIDWVHHIGGVGEYVKYA